MAAPSFDPTMNVFPVSSGFVASWMDGYYSKRCILKADCYSNSFQAEWCDFGRLAGTGCFKNRPQDIELAWSNWEMVSFSHVKNDGIRTRLEGIKQQLHNFMGKQGSKQIPYVDSVKYWVKYLRGSGEEGKVKCGAFLRKLKAGQVNKSDPGVYLAFASAQGNPGFWKTLDVTDIIAGEPVYPEENTGVPYATERPTKQAPAQQSSGFQQDTTATSIAGEFGAPNSVVFNNNPPPQPNQATNNFNQNFQQQQNPYQTPGPSAQDLNAQHAQAVYAAANGGSKRVARKLNYITPTKQGVERAEDNSPKRRKLVFEEV